MCLAKNVALRSGSGEGRRLSFINSTAGVLPVRWLIMLLVNYGESCRLILGTVSFLQYMVLCTHPPTAGPVFTSVVVRPAWLHVTEFRYSFTPSPQHKHWRQFLSKSISLWQQDRSLHTLEYAEACPLWSSHSFKNLICCFVKLAFPFTLRKSSSFITACHWASTLKSVHLK